MRTTSGTVFAAIVFVGALAACGPAPDPSPVPTQAGLPNPAVCLLRGARWKVGDPH